LLIHDHISYHLFFLIHLNDYFLNFVINFSILSLIRLTHFIKILSFLIITLFHFHDITFFILSIWLTYFFPPILYDIHSLIHLKHWVFDCYFLPFLYFCVLTTQFRLLNFHSIKEVHSYSSKLSVYLANPFSISHSNFQVLR
jgi:hypothetical protein